MSNELVPITLDEINKLTGWDREVALRAYQRNLEKQRKQDKREAHNRTSRICAMKRRRKNGNKK